MKNKQEILDLLDEPEVQEFFNYCEQLEGELVNLKFEKNNNKELILPDNDSRGYQRM